MEQFLGIIYVIGLFCIIFKVFGNKNHSSEDNSEPESNLCTEQNVNINDISRQLAKANDVMEQIKNVEELITDIEVCEPGIHSKVFTLSWVSESGKNLSFQFWVNGGDELNTDLMLKLSYSERRHLRSLLKKELQNLGGRSYANVTQTIRKSDDRGVVYND